MKKYIIIILSLFLIILMWVARPKTLPTTNLKERAIFIDPGHGGPDGGTESSCGIYEKDVVLAISLYLKDLFEGNDFKVYLTRDGDYDLASKNSQNRKREDIRKRVNLINSSDANVYLSIHANSYSSPIIYGAQTFYQPGNQEAKKLAEYIQNSIKLGLNNTKRDALAINDKFLIDNVKRVGCLVEVGFLSNPRELQLLKTEDYKMKMAMVIYFGVLDYLENHN